MYEQQQQSKLPLPVVIIADGDFPHHPVPLKALEEAATIVCCDGAVEKLLLHGFTPHHIVGDMDSIPASLKNDFTAILHPCADQETNDLTKAVTFCVKSGCKEATILGATGGREDHALANISLLADYVENLTVQMITDTGIFIPILQSQSFSCRKKEQISIFCLTAQTTIKSEGLKFPTDKVVFDSWWKGSLNETTGGTFRLSFDYGKVIVYSAF